MDSAKEETTTVSAIFCNTHNPLQLYKNKLDPCKASICFVVYKPLKLSKINQMKT